MTEPEILSIMSRPGHHYFQAVDLTAVQHVAARLQDEGHAVTVSVDVNRERVHDRLMAAHYLTCLKCVGVR